MSYQNANPDADEDYSASDLGDSAKAFTQGLAAEHAGYYAQDGYHENGDERGDERARLRLAHRKTDANG